MTLQRVFTKLLSAEKYLLTTCCTRGIEERGLSVGGDVGGVPPVLFFSGWQAEASGCKTKPLPDTRFTKAPISHDRYFFSRSVSRL